MPDPLLVEEKSRLSILVIEDSPEFGKNALEALKGHDARLATNLKEALDALASGTKFDFILSDAHVPLREGEQPVAIILGMLETCFEKDIPVCFVTKADHHGLIDIADEGYVSLRAVTLGEASEALMTLSNSKEEASAKKVFSTIKPAASANVKTDSKTPELWAKALDMVRNAATKSSPIAGAIRKVRSIGLDVVMEKGLPKVIQGTGPKA